MKKNKFDLFLVLKKLKKNKIFNNLSTLNDERKRLDFVKNTILDLIKNNDHNNFKVNSSSDLKMRSAFRQNLFKKLEISKNRENHLKNEINHNI